MSLFGFISDLKDLCQPFGTYNSEDEKIASSDCEKREEETT